MHPENICAGDLVTVVKGPPSWNQVSPNGAVVHGENCIFNGAILRIEAVSLPYAAVKILRGNQGQEGNLKLTIPLDLRHVQIVLVDKDYALAMGCSTAEVVMPPREPTPETVGEGETWALRVPPKKKRHARKLGIIREVRNDPITTYAVTPEGDIDIQVLRREGVPLLSVPNGVCSLCKGPNYEHTRTCPNNPKRPPEEPPEVAKR